MMAVPGLLKKHAFFAILHVLMIIWIYYNLYNQPSVSSIGQAYVTGQPYAAANGSWPTVAPTDEVKDRLRLLQDFCKDYEPCTKKKNCTFGNAPRAIIVHDRYKVMWCDIPKVASTTLKWRMGSFSGKTLPPPAAVHTASFLRIHGLRLLSTYTRAEQHERLDKYLKVIFVRHPLLRLLSAYKDKFVTYTYRLQAAQRHLDRIRKSRRSFNPVYFDEFIWLATKSPMRRDPHWATFEQRCMPCGVKYDFIGKMETFERDLKELLAMKYNVSKADYTVSSNHTRHPTHASFHVLKEYLLNLTETQRSSIYDIYDHDFKMFGYKWDGIV